LTANWCAINHRLFPSHMTFPVPSAEIYDGEVSSSAGAGHGKHFIPYENVRVALVLLTDRTGFVSNISYFGAMAGRGGVDGCVLWVLWNGKTLHTSTFLTLTLDEGECSALHPGRSIHGHRSLIIYRIRDGVNLRAGLIVLERKISCLRRESNHVSSGF